MSKVSLLSLVLLFTTYLVSAQSGAELNFKITNANTGIAKLAYYYGDKQYIKDSTEIDGAGNFVFQSAEKYDQGIYLVVLPPDNKYFEVIMDEHQNWTISSDYNDLVNAKKIKGSPENEVFSEYLKYLEVKKKDVEGPTKIRKQYEADTTDTNYKDKPAYKQAIEDIKKVNDQVVAYKTEFVKKYPDALITKIIRASKDPEVPEELGKDDPDNKDRIRWLYYRDHYWDDIDLGDDRLLRTPVLHGKLVQYMTKLVVQVPDSINMAADKLMARTTDLSDIQKYFIIWITNHFETSKQMGMDAVFVHMAQNYYMSGKAYWADSTLLAKISERARKLDPILIGKVAPNLFMKDTTGTMHSLHGVKANFTIAYFWDPDCGHCKKETPKLKEFYSKFKDELDVEVFGVNTTTEEELWKEFIIEHDLNWINVQDPKQLTAFKYRYDLYSTPVIYLLDRDKKIIAKRIGVEDLEGFIKAWNERVQ